MLVAVLRDFDRLTTYFVVVEWSALLFAVGAVFVLRRRLPRRGAAVPHPWLPVGAARSSSLGTLVGLAAIVWGEIAQSTPNYSPVWGLLIAAAGFPVYRAWRSAQRRAQAASG